MMDSLKLKPREHIVIHDSPYINASVVTIQAMVNPIMNDDAGFYIPPRSIVFSYNGERKRNKKDCIVPYAFSDAFSNEQIDHVTDEKMKRKISSMKILGVAMEGIPNARDAKEFPNECGRLAIAIHGAVSVSCDTRLLESENPYYGDPIYVYPRHSNGFMRHGNHEYNYCIVTKTPIDSKFILGTYLEHDKNELRIHLKAT